MSEKKVNLINAKSLVSQRKFKEKNYFDKKENDYNYLLLCDFSHKVKFLPCGIRDKLISEFEVYDRSARDQDLYASMNTSLIKEESYKNIIFCAKLIELEAVFSALSIDSEISSPDDIINGVQLYTCDLDIGHIDTQRTIVAYLAEDTNVESAAAVSHILNSCEVERAYLLGMCAGIKSRMSIGHVVIGSSVYYVEPSKLTSGSEEDRPRYIESNVPAFYMSDTLDGLNDLYRTAVKSIVNKNKFVPDFLSDDYEVVHKIGKISSNEKLVADSSFMANEAGRDQQIKAVDMESYGFSRACDMSSVPWLVFKSVSDYGENDRGECSVLESDVEK